MYTSHMAVKTVSLKTEAYERLRGARRYPGESFSEVILRARWPEETVTGAELLARYRRKGSHFSEAELDAMEAAKATAAPPEDKWAAR
jgi:predicted CopG family antitoxin